MTDKAKQALAIIDELRARGAVEIAVGDIKALFPGPPSPRGEKLEPAAQAEYEKRLAEKRRPRSLEERLLRPLGIVKEPAA